MTVYTVYTVYIDLVNPNPPMIGPDECKPVSTPLRSQMQDKPTVGARALINAQSFPGRKRILPGVGIPVVSTRHCSLPVILHNVDSSAYTYKSRAAPSRRITHIEEYISAEYLGSDTR
jgi:hypothetical protein